MKLYKYVSAKTVRRILSSGLIRFTQPGAFNDPFELRPIFHLRQQDDFLEEVREEALRKWFDSWVLSLPAAKRTGLTYDGFRSFIESQGGRKGQELLDRIFTAGRTIVDEHNTAVRPSYFDQIIGICCLTAEPQSLLMWAHYSDRHQGFVIEFDTSHQFFWSGDPSVHLVTKVDYSSRRPVTAITAPDYYEVFFTKSPEWKDEREWRMVLPLREATKRVSREPYDICPFRVPSAAISSLYMGCRTTDADKEEVLDLLVSNPNLAHVKVFQAMLDAERFAIRFKSAGV